MSVRRDKRFGTWFYRKWVRTPDGCKVRIFRSPKAFKIALAKTPVQKVYGIKKAHAKGKATDAMGKPLDVIARRQEDPSIGGEVGVDNRARRAGVDQHFRELDRRSTVPCVTMVRWLP